jgi:hypothetical protein
MAFKHTEIARSNLTRCDQVNFLFGGMSRVLLLNTRRKGALLPDVRAMLQSKRNKHIDT